ncbi:MAG: hypothetical protein WC769_07375 [Thermodesulfovibrionales bacterium]|jgi:hypothetical protein
MSLTSKRIDIKRIMPRRTLREIITFLFMKTVFNGKPHTDKDLSSMYVIRNKRESKYKCEKRSNPKNSSSFTTEVRRHGENNALSNNTFTAKVKDAYRTFLLLLNTLPFIPSPQGRGRFLSPLSLFSPANPPKCGEGRGQG